MSEIHEYANDDVVVMLLGNKSDMTSERLIKREEAEKLAKVGTLYLASQFTMYKD